MHYSESEIRRIGKVAFEAAQKRNKRLCSVDKMNVLETTQLWRDVINELAPQYPDVQLTHMVPAPPEPSPGWKTRWPPTRP